MDLQELRKIRQGYLDVQLAIHKRVAKTFDPGILEVARRRLDELQLGLDHLAPVLALLAPASARWMTAFTIRSAGCNSRWIDTPPSPIATICCWRK